MKFLIILFLFVFYIFGENYNINIYTEEWEPISYTFKKTTNGYSVEVVKEILKRTDITEPIKILPWARAYYEALNKRNVVIFAMTYTENRNKNFTFLGPITKGTIKLYSQNKDEIFSEKIKSESTISVYRSSQEHEILTALEFKNLEIGPTPVIAALKFFNNRADYWANVDLTTPYILKKINKNEDDLFSIYNLKNIKLYIAFSRGTEPEIIQIFYEKLKEIEKEGILNTIHKTYFSTELKENIKLIEIKD